MNGQAGQLGAPDSVPAEAAALEDQVRRRLGGQVRDFRLVVSANGVVLRGSVPSYYVKQLAQHMIMGAMGLTVLANEIEVSAAPGMVEE
jgi:hypothetical protein